MKNPTFYKTIVNNVFWQQWVKDNERKPKFDVHESIECGWISDRHFNAFLKFASDRLDLGWKKKHGELLKKYNKLLAKVEEK